MKNSSWRRFLRGASLRRDVDELRELVTRYVKEETVEPLRDLGRFLVWGAIGSVFVGFGSVVLLVGALRYLQWQFRVLDGSLSWLPYVIVALLGVLVLAVTVWRVVSGTARRRVKVNK